MRGKSFKNSAIWERLEKKREDLKESMEVFSGRFGMTKDNYSHYKTKRSIPPKMAPVVAELLGVTVEEMRASSDIEEKPVEQQLSAEDLQFLAKLVEVIGHPVAISKLLPLLEHKK